MSEVKIWTTQQLADELGVSQSYIVQLIQGHSPLLKLQASKLWGRWIIEEKEAQRFIQEYRNPGHYTPQQLAAEIGKSRKYVQDALTGYGGKKEPRLAGEKRGNRWVISKEEAQRFIDLHN